MLQHCVLAGATPVDMQSYSISNSPDLINNVNISVKIVNQTFSICCPKQECSFMTQLIDYLVDHRGISSDFVDAWGKLTAVAARNQHKLLEAMGYSLDNETTLGEQLEAEAAKFWSQALAPVEVFRKGAKLFVRVRTSSDNATKVHTLKVSCESGESYTHKFVPADANLTASQEINGLKWQQHPVELPFDIPLGYHHMQLIFNRRIVGRSALIIAPQACYIPKSIKQGKKIWGLSVQLYCLRSRRNWGIGDFTDLVYLSEHAAALGADFIGLNPIHSLYPANPEACSPYGPSSRLWLNFLYIDVERVPGFHDIAVQDWLSQDHIQAKLSHVRTINYVDYAQVCELKHHALELAFDAFDKQFLAQDSKEKLSFEKFVSDGGKSLHSLAIFEALQTSLKRAGKASWGWPVFPLEYQSADSVEVATFAKRNTKLVSFYLFLQWQAAIQFEKASRAAKKAGMEIGLYRDLAVGVSEGGAETWANKSLYCKEVSVGAPPDILGPLGQKWGLPPMDPAQLQEQQYQPIIDLFASNMKASGALRIDHVMALLRLWWVHKDDDASQGAYVNYPVEDLLAILALESHKNKSVVIGEDLGTVPETIREKLENNGMFSYRLFFFEQAEDGGFYSPAHYPQQSMATLTTHDMPTLMGYWDCSDLTLGKAVGLYPDQDVLNSLYQTRKKNKQYILDSLHGHGAVSSNISANAGEVEMTPELSYAMQLHMAGGSSALLSLQLEDWLHMEQPVNIPGTYDEYPNWKRKLTLELEDLFCKPDIIAFAQALTERRQRASNKT
jgi:4-alpha-glucanotransferase